jgi:ABC-type nickel/cobalt efflux system permease component RcnA
MSLRRFLIASALVLGFLAAGPTPGAGAHPLGNFTVNQYAGLVVHPGTVSVELVVDMAEIPAFQSRGEFDTDGDGSISGQENRSFRDRACESLRHGVSLGLDGRALPTTVTGSALAFPPGQAGLDTLRLTCRLVAPARPVAGGRLEFANDNYRDRVGWREVTAAGEGIELVGSDVPGRSPSRRLTRYPQDLLSSPLDVRSASLGIGDSGGMSLRTPRSDDSGTPTGLLPVGVDRFAAAFTGLVARQDFSVWFALMALAAAVALGALHALAPGHGKTVMAAYLVGQQGSLRQALVLGMTVSATHTAGVLILGVVVSGSAAFVPEQIYPWLGLASGALLAWVGAGLLFRAWRRRLGNPGSAFHHHDHGHEHAHSHGHGPEPDRGHATGETGMSRRTLVAMGAAGGMVPGPSALVVLLGAIALGRTWFGIALVVGYGLGMAVTLVGAGLLLVRFRSVIDRRWTGGRRFGVVRALPLVTASLVMVAGLGLALKAIGQMAGV